MEAERTDAPISNRFIRAQTKRTLLALVNTVRAYLPRDGMEKDEFISRVIGILDNPSINAVIRTMERDQPHDQ